MNNERCHGIYPKKLSITAYPTFSDRLKVIMEIREYTTVELAKKIYTSPQTIAMYRCGKRMPSPDILCLIARELQVSTDFLLGLSDFIYM